MICENCDHEHDGSTGTCPACGVPCPPHCKAEEPESVKKKSHKKGTGKRSVDNSEEE